MPLKRPKGIPKIPKARKKKAHTAITTIPSKKPDKLEYLCKVYFLYDSKKKKQFCAFRIETVVEFTSFSYEISVEHIREKNVLNFIIMGLTAKMDAVPLIQPAKKEILLEDLVGNFSVNVLKQDGAINSADFYLNIYKKEIKLKKEYIPKKKNNRLFCKFSVAENEFSFPE